MLIKFKSVFFKNIKILGLLFLIFFTIAVALYAAHQKNQSAKKYNNFLDNIYLKKTLNEIINNLEPRYKKYKHKIKSGETFDKILNQYLIDKKEIKDIKESLIKKVNINKLNTNQKIQIILDQTSFYGESGGQIGDTGTISGDGMEIYIDKVIRKKNIFLHCGTVKKGEICRNQLVKTKVDNSNRAKAESNHTATHLLQSALKLVIDENVSQRGSLVAFNKLRFDFNSPQPLSKEQILKIESLVNTWILENHPIEVKSMGKDDALKAGALAMFGEKYGDVVRVVLVVQIFQIFLKIFLVILEVEEDQETKAQITEAQI